jgi:hypothetical protein
MSARKSVRVRRGNSHLTVYAWNHTASGSLRWRFAWRETASAPWRYVTRSTKAAAIAEAERTLELLEAGQSDIAELDAGARHFLGQVHRLTPEEDRDAVLAFLRGRRKSAEVGGAVARYIEFKRRSAGETTRHLEAVRRELETMAGAFSGRSLVDVLPADLVAWHRTRTEGLAPKTQNEIRGALVAFYRWCILEGIFPREVTPAERLPKVELPKHERRILTPHELRRLALEVQRAFRPWLVLGAFAGLRPEEIAPALKKGMSKRGKRGIRCEEIDFEGQVIHLPAEVSKVDRPRIIPFGENLARWLEWAGIGPGMRGPVCLRNPSEDDETSRLGRLVFDGKWPQDVLRHSFGSYRNAVIRNLPQVAEEMGTSVTMLHKHYHNPRPAAEGAAWFGLLPPGRISLRKKAAGVPISSDEIDPAGASEQLEGKGKR